MNNYYLFCNKSYSNDYVTILSVILLFQLFLNSHHLDITLHMIIFAIWNQSNSIWKIARSVYRYASVFDFYGQTVLSIQSR